MFLKFKLFNYRIVIYCRRVQPIDGVNSNLSNGHHIPMLDLDGYTRKQVRIEIIRLQKMFRLGTASIVSTGKPKSYHVYFWTRCTWRQAIMIVSSCPLNDLKHLQFSLLREHFTLRLSNKNTRVIKVIEEVVSIYKTTVSYEDLISFVKYETANIEVRK